MDPTAGAVPGRLPISTAVIALLMVFGRAPGRGDVFMTIRVYLPPHLRALAGVQGEVQVDVPSVPTIGAGLDALEEDHPQLRGTIRDHGKGERRPMIRFFASGEDLSHEPPDSWLPADVASGDDVFLIVGAIAGG